MPSELDEFFRSLEAEMKKTFFTQSSENNLLRVIQSFFDKNSLIRDAIKYPQYIEILITASSNSNYICDILVRDPEFFYWIVNPENLLKKPSSNELAKTVREITNRYKSFGSKLNALKSFKRKEILRTAVQDSLKIFPLPDITAQLSLIATTILDSLFQLCYREVLNKYKLNTNSTYCIAALGKLGGRELNYSSDTDLIIFYDKESKYGSKYYSEYLTEAVKFFIESSSRLTDTGYLYRIDFRLRPDGRNSALCRSLQEYLNYYESRGESWERQMLIKCDFLSGNHKLFEKFISYLTPFIYPMSHIYSPAEQVNKLKSAIEKNLKSELNIKLTKGGIRDIEFSVQVLQLLNGGKIKAIRKQNTLKTIEELSNEGLLSVKEKKVLTEAYTLFRKIEHYLQLMNDRQVHTIPEAGAIVDKMAAYLGFSDRQQLLDYLSATRKTVREIYLSIIPGQNEEEPENSIFRNKAQAEKDFTYLREGKELTGGRIYDQKTQKLFNQLEPILLKQLTEMTDPDLALKNFSFFIKSSGIPSIWYREFLDVNFLNSFLLLCSFNKKGINLLNSDPELQDFLLSKRIFQKYKLSELKNFPVRKLLLYLSTRVALKDLPAKKISEMLSSVLISKVRLISETQLGNKNYIVAALGSLGSGEMGFSSDLDLLFIITKDSKLIENKFKDLLNRINKELYFFKADCRLRPEGKTSQLAWDADAYIKYIESRGRIWELQSLTKLRFICGDKKSFNRIVKAIQSRIKKEDCRNIKQSIFEMKKKVLESPISQLSQKKSIKRTAGGLIDIEYLLQSFILCAPDLFSKCRGKKNLEIIDILLAQAGNYGILEGVKERYTFLRSLELFLQCAFDTDKTYFPFEEDKRSILAAYFETEIRELENLFKINLQLNSTLSDKILKTK